MANVEIQKNEMVSITQLVYEMARESNDRFRELAEKQAAEKRQKEAETARELAQSSSPDVIVDVKDARFEPFSTAPTPAPPAAKVVDVTV